MSDFLTIQTQTAWGETLRRFAQWCEPSLGWRTLDIGCGPGLLPAYFESFGCLAFGIDIDLESLFTPLHHHLICADAYHLPFPNQYFDLATISNVLFFLPHPTRILQEVHRILADGGILCTLNPSEKLTLALASDIADQKGLQGASRQSLLGWAARAEGGQRWDADQTHQLFQRAGFDCRESVLKIGTGLARFSRGIKQS